MAGSLSFHRSCCLCCHLIHTSSWMWRVESRPWQSRRVSPSWNRRPASCASSLRRRSMSSMDCKSESGMRNPLCRRPARVYRTHWTSRLEGKSHPVLLPFSALPPLSTLLNLGFLPLCFSVSFSPARSCSRSFTLIAGPSYASSYQWTS